MTTADNPSNQILLGFQRNHAARESMTHARRYTAYGGRNGKHKEQHNLTYRHLTMHKRTE
jgi:hypothetical protein